MCDTMVSLTADGILFAKNSDRDPNESQVLRWYPAADNGPADAVQCTWSTIPQAGHTHAVLLSQPWWMWGAEIGANEHGVVIGNEAVFTRGTGSPGGELLGMDLLRLALERAATAEQAVQVLVELLERHGQGGSCSHEHPRFSYDNSFLVADPNGAIVLETAGRRWATEVVQGPGRSISNGLTIPGFADKHADRLRGRVAACAVRRGLTERAAAGASGPEALFAALRQHGHAEGPDFSPLNGALSAPCAHAGGLLTSTQTTASWVADLRPGQGGRHWVTATAAPCLSVFKPVTVARPLEADPATMPTNVFDPGHLWWRHERLHRLALRDLPSALSLIAPERDRLERQWLADPPDVPGAFAAADQLTDRWVAYLAHHPPPETRPPWLRALWRQLDRSAGIPAERG